MATTTAEADLLQAGHIVKERWKVGAIFSPLILSRPSVPLLHLL